jgi:hypothetical protein
MSLEQAIRYALKALLPAPRLSFRHRDALTAREMT